MQRITCPQFNPSTLNFSIVVVLRSKHFANNSKLPCKSNIIENSLKS